MTDDAPEDVRALAEERSEARQAKDFARSDALRAELLALGWVVRDSPEGSSLERAPAYPVLARAGDLPDRSGEPDSQEVSCAVLVEGWPDDVRRCLASLIEHSTAHVLVLECGDVDGAGAVVHEVAQAHPDRVEAHHLERPCGWSEARTALARADTARVHVWVDPAIELTGDAIAPLAAAVGGGVVAAGGFGVVASADWLSFSDAQPGDVDALNGYLVAFDRQALLATPPHPKATFYRNADLELGFALREAGGRVVMTGELPVVMHRHRGYHDSDPALRDKQSRKTYDRFLQRFRGRDDLRA